jgi:hypothetical protein
LVRGWIGVGGSGPLGVMTTALYNEVAIMGDRQQAMMAADIAYIKDNWAVLAAEAWSGWVEHGCGAMLIDLGIGLEPLAGYRTNLSANPQTCAWPSPAIAAQIQHYDPQCEVVILILRSDRTLMAYRLASAALPPPIAYERLRRALHTLAA